MKISSHTEFLKWESSEKAVCVLIIDFCTCSFCWLESWSLSFKLDSHMVLVAQRTWEELCVAAKASAFFFQRHSEKSFDLHL